MGVGSRWRQWLSRVFPASSTLPVRYAAFRRLLARDHTAHELLAELEEIGRGHRRVDWLLVQARYEALLAAVSDMVTELMAMAPRRYDLLRRKVRAWAEAGRRQWPDAERLDTPPYVVGFAEAVAIDPAVVGGKAAHLVQVHQELGLPVPAGFVITTTAFYRLLPAALQQDIDQRLATLDLAAEQEVAAIATALTARIEATPVPDEVSAAVTAAAAAMTAAGASRFAVRSSARAEDSDLTFAGQYRTVLDVPVTALMDSYRQVIASRYGERALHYRVQHGLADHMTPMAVMVLAMVDAAVSGVMAVGDPAEGGAESVVIHAVAGQGEQLVHGEATPEVIRVDDAHASALLTAGEIEQLAAWGRRIARFYGQPQDVEWCRDQQGRLLLLQCRPLPGGPPGPVAPAPSTPVALPPLLHGGAHAMGGVGSGQVVQLRPGQPLQTVPDGAVLVAASLPPEYAPLLPRLAAVVAEEGSSVGHCALVAREYGVPTLVQVAQARAVLAEGQAVTVDADQAVIYAGLLGEVPLRRGPLPESPLASLVVALLAELAPLHLPEPGHPDFTVENCRSLHDVIRFVHEQGMAEMFGVAYRQGARAQGSKLLLTTLPVRVYLVDIGQGLAATARNQAEVGLDLVVSRPLQALWQGLSHPGIRWRSIAHFDWQSFTDAVMGNGVVSGDARIYASYALVDQDYVHFNIRFGYHYTVVEALAGSDPENNYVALRFVGGGADFTGRTLRLVFIAEVLMANGFRVTIRGDLLDGVLGREQDEALLAKLVTVGRLLGATQLLDMVIADEAMARQFAREFMQGRGDFSPVGAKEG